MMIYVCAGESGAGVGEYRPPRHVANGLECIGSEAETGKPV